jgi:hypothetical protein
MSRTMTRVNKLRIKNGVSGTRDIEGKVTRVRASKPGGERVSSKNDEVACVICLALDPSFV